MSRQRAFVSLWFFLNLCVCVHVHVPTCICICPRVFTCSWVGMEASNWCLASFPFVLHFGILIFSFVLVFLFVCFLRRVLQLAHTDPTSSAGQSVPPMLASQLWTAGPGFFCGHRVSEFSPSYLHGKRFTNWSITPLFPSFSQAL